MRIFDFVDKIDGVLAEALAERVQYDKDGNKLPGLADAIKAKQDAQNQPTVPGTLKAGDGSTVVSGDGTPVQAGTQAAPTAAPAQAAEPATEPTVTPVAEPTATATPLPAQPAPAPKQWAKGVLGMGSSGPEVTELQKRLGLNPDGKFGPQTRDAVINLQKKLGVKADGAYGPQTKAADEKQSSDSSQKVVPPAPTPTTDPMGADDGASIMAAAGTSPTAPTAPPSAPVQDDALKYAIQQGIKMGLPDVSPTSQRIADMAKFYRANPTEIKLKESSDDIGFANDELNRLVSLVHYR